MKYGVIAIWLLVCASLVLADDDHSRDRSNDNDNSAEEDGEYQQCYHGLMKCFKRVMKYYASGKYNGPDTVKDGGLRPVCVDVTDQTQCISGVIDQCPRDFIDIFSKVNDALNHICVDKIDDIETHWSCLTDDFVARSLTQCSHFVQNVTQCETDNLMECVGMAYNHHPELCKEGVADLATGIIKKLVDINPECYQIQRWQRLALAFLRK